MRASPNRGAVPQAVPLAAAAAAGGAAVAGEDVAAGPEAREGPGGQIRPGGGGATLNDDPRQRFVGGYNERQETVG